jgi:hypothetical protein
MKNTNDINEIVPEEVPETSELSDELSDKIKTDRATVADLAEKIAEQTAELANKVSELSHLNGNEGVTGFNPTLAELAEVSEGIRAELQNLGKELDTTLPNRYQASLFARAQEKSAAQ